MRIPSETASDVELRWATDLEAMARLQSLSTRLVQTGELDSLLHEILSAAADLTGTDKGNIQLFNASTGRLRIVVHQGLGQRFVEHFAEDGWVATCDAAAGTHERVIVKDVAALVELAGTQELEIVLEDGIRSIQSTPMLARDGRLLGMLNNHYRTPHCPGEHELRYLDLLARMGADFIERCQSEQALREADRRKDVFLATLAHEVRGPLAPLSNALEVLTRAAEDPSAVRWAREVMQRQLKQLTHLVNDLLDLSRINQDKIELHRQPAMLHGIIEQAIECCRPLIDARKQKLSVALPSGQIQVDADAVRLTQVFSNLIHNACKFTAPEGELGITCESTGAQAVVRIRDSGVGISPAALERIFDIFSQVGRSAGQDAGGLGIGLYLVKRLVEMHGGTVAASSDGPGHGSEFIVRLPAMPECAVTPDAALAAAHAMPRCRFLVVDDNADSADSLAELLRMDGNEAHTAHNAHRALEVAEALRPHCVLLDIGLPGMSGYDVCRRLRAAPWGQDALLVAVTGWGQRDDRRQSAEAGFNHHLVKPVDYEALKSLVSAHQSARGLRL